MAEAVHWTLAIPTEVKCEYAGIPQGDYYTDLESAVRVQGEFPACFERLTGYRPTTSYQVPVTAYEGVAALGGELVFPRDHQPMLSNQGHVLQDIALDAVAVPDPWQDQRFRLHLRQYQELAVRYPVQVARGGLAGQEGPVTTAGLLRGERFFEDCLTRPSLAHSLLDLCTTMFIHWTRAEDAALGVSRTVIGIADDYAGLLNPALWPEFVLPYYRRICSELGAQGCSLHSELLRRSHLPLLRVLPLAGLNFGEDQYLQPEDVAEALDVPFGWHILAVAEMLQGTPEGIRRRYSELVSRGVRHIMVELTVGTPPANVRAFLEAAQTCS